MERKGMVAKALLVSSLALTTLPAGAVSFNSSFTLARSNVEGTTFAVLPPHANHFCYLSRVSVEETDTAGERATCRVRRSGSVWLLEAILGRSSDNDVVCSATCYNN